MYKCAIIGVSGPRAIGHATAYRYIKRGTLVAGSARNRGKLDEFCDRFGIENRYLDYREMLRKERPDLVHVNTPPDVRLSVLEAARDAYIPAVLVEKPIAIEGDDFRKMADFANESERCGTGPRIAINHQLHFHPRRRHLQQLVRDGGIGDIRFVEASCGMNLAYQGTHSLQAIGAFLSGHEPISVYGQVSGTEGLAPNPKSHFAPDNCSAVISYDGRIEALLRCGEIAPRVGDGPVHTHKRIAVYGTLGYVLWTMWSWETNLDGTRETGEHDYHEEDELGQAAMTDAMFDWIEDDTRIHPLHLSSALRDFNVILGLYMSALRRKAVRLPVVPEDGLIEKLRERLDV